jgi:hypothetical protein
MPDWVETLERLQALRASGALTDAEFNAEKAKLLATDSSETSAQSTTEATTAWSASDHRKHTTPHFSTLLMIAVLVAFAIGVGIFIMISPSTDHTEGVAARRQITIGSPSKQSAQLNIALGKFLDFKAGELCSYSDELDIALRESSELSRKSIIIKDVGRVPVIHESYDLDGERMVKETIQLNGVWKNVRIVGIVREGLADSGLFSIFYIFDDDAETVHSLLNRSGFALPDLNVEKAVGTEGIASISITNKNIPFGKSALECIFFN